MDAQVMDGQVRAPRALGTLGALRASQDLDSGTPAGKVPVSGAPGAPRHYLE